MEDPLETQPESFDDGEDAFNGLDVPNMEEGDGDKEDLIARIEALEDQQDIQPLPEMNFDLFPVQVGTDGSWTELVALNGALVVNSTNATETRLFSATDNSSGAALIILTSNQGMALELEDDSGRTRFLLVSGGTANMQSALARLTSVNTTTNATTWIYSATFQNGATSNAYNSFEWNGTTSSMIQGTPGSLGVNCDSNGLFTGTSCHAKPIGSTGWIVLTYDNINSRWIFSAPNSAG